MSAVSLYYYLQVLKQIYVADVPAGADEIKVPAIISVVLCVLAGAVILFGCMPELILGPLSSAIRLAGF